jgi:outer membrane protein
LVAWRHLWSSGRAVFCSVEPEKIVVNEPTTAALKMNPTRVFALLAVGLASVCLTLPVAAAEPWTFERAISHALTNSPDARLAQQRITAAQAGLRQANAALMPQLQFQSSYFRTDNPLMVFGSALNQRAFSFGMDFNDVPDADDLNVKGQLAVPLYAGGRLTAGRNAAKAHNEAAKQDAEATRNTLAFEVARAFHTVLKTREFIKATEAGVRSFENNVAIADKRLNAGTLLKADVLDVQVRLAQAREDSVRAHNASELAVRALRNLLGIDQGEFDVANSAPAVTAPASDDFSPRPELAASRERRRAAEADQRIARAALRKALGLSQLDSATPNR